MDFRNKISAYRLLQSRSDELQSALESDRGRIINSAAVRRLQQKTQVFPLERNAAVRSRLTHSLEVQQTGRFIVQTIFKLLSAEQQAACGLTGLERPIESLVEMACLLHDVGNPPFGHSGESAINSWFNQALPELTSRHQLQGKPLWHTLSTELAQFEGNAQAIRLVHSLQRMNLTYSQVGCILKYTRLGTEGKPDKNHSQSYLQKKPGYYFAEQQFVQQLWQQLETEAGCRQPLTYIMEAADDISYCLADLEDAVEKGLFSLAELARQLNKAFASLEPQGRLIATHSGGSESFSALVKAALDKAEAEPINKNSAFFIKLRVGMIHPLVRHAAEQFIANIDEVYHGSLNRALLEDDSQYHAITSTFKQVARQFVFNQPEVETLELQGQRIIAGLLDCYQPLLLLSAADFTAVLADQGYAFGREQRLAHRLPNKHVAAYQLAVAAINDNHTALELYYRCRLLQDFISGMTDHFAFDEYQALVLCAS
ncbi:dGTPase [Arsukibacterium tuosuense]|uniref:Probable deoxyguanosinetriphosphate triphosphohydrolase n=1 Tax=Arsukibacterium tuosuense TaxID=1323745 RepID=A0A285IM66_9GAMM|nr:dGTPase [Arsukibacterium tuosuense]SNY49069.1 dGTPase [Arsukibacterium tuosuense]